MTKGKSYRWKCSKCGYVLPKESDLLKVCPDCGAVGEFVKELGVLMETVCKNCGDTIKQFFPVGWCHVKTENIHCYPDANDVVRSLIVATPKEAGF